MTTITQENAEELYEKLLSKIFKLEQENDRLKEELKKHYEFDKEEIR